MRRFVFFFICLLVCELTMAGPVSQKMARQKALHFMKGADLQLAVQAKGEHPAYYIYNKVKDKRGGYVIVSGDDRTETVLGYADEGSFSADNMPEDLRWWLACYEQQIEMVRQGDATPAAALTGLEAVAPLVTTMWNQSGPYNLQCPTFKDNGITLHYPTGCVATAMAQILKYWSSDFETPAISSYTTSSLLINMPSLPATTFDWSLMKDSYRSDETDKTAQEVAKLMRYCGQAVEMDYNVSGSGAYVGPEDFIQYFGFDGAAQTHERRNYLSSEWETLIYQELSAKRPVYFSGANINVGHAFVLDGYDGAGYYHINWGWGGYSNGYFLLTVMNPEDKGIGGGTSEDGFTLRQSIITGLQPDAGNTPDILMSIEDIATDKSVYTRSSSSQNFQLKITSAHYNQSSKMAAFELGFALYKDGQFKRTISAGATGSLGTGWGYNAWKSTISMGANFSDGKYVLKSVCRVNGTMAWKETVGANRHYLELELEGNKLTVTPVNSEQVNLVVNSFTLEGIMKPSESITVKANVSNKGTTLVNNLTLTVDGEAATAVALMADPGESDNIEFHFEAPEAGSHLVKLHYFDSKGDVLAQAEMIIEERKEMNLTATKPYPVGIAHNVYDVASSTLRMTTKITNNERTDFKDFINCWLCKYDSANGNYYVETPKRQFVTIQANQTATMEFVFEGLEYQGQYKVIIFDPLYKELAQSSSYTITATTGIENIRKNESEHEGAAAIYDLYGRQVDRRDNQQLPAGIYVVKGKKIVVK